ncbi:MAG: right-handed parallel beta-helix repeat-containing protein, partial [Acidobacteriota bacterium]
MRTDRPSNPISTSIVSLLVALVGSAFAIAASSPIGLTDQAPQASPSFVPALERTDAVGHALEQGTIFVVTTAGDDGPGSLRRAIEAANATPNREGSRDRIVFQIAGPGPHSIRLTSALPPITESVVIYGYSQPGSAPNSRVTGSDAMVMIELDGTQSDGAHGLIINSSDSIVHGLAIHGFAGDGIRVIGGARNWIAGNLIGASSTPGVSGGNGGHGVLVLDSFDNLIGGLAPAARNEICGSGASGVLVAGDRSIGNTIVGNSIHANLAAGIELEGRAALDSADRDTGPNLQQNRPLLTRVYWPEASDDEAPGARIEGTLESAPSTRYRLEFFVTRASEMPGDRGDRSPLDPRSLPVQGEKLLVATDVVTASDGTAHFVAIVPDGVESHALVTATATDPLGNTSEFSDPVLAPTVIKSWNNAAGGNWSVGTNWTPNGVPATTDDVQITLAGTYTVTLDVSSTVASLTLGAATGTQTLSIAANTLTLSGASSVSSNGVLAQSGGTITGAGTLTVNGAYNWSAGTLTGAGTTTINGTLTLSGGAVKDITSSRTLNTTSTVTWSGTGAVRIGSGSVINNSGTWDCQTDSNIQNPFGGTATFNNSGTFKKSAGTGTSTVFNSLTAFNNTGSVLAQSGTLNLLAAGTHTGAFNGSGGQVQFSTSVHNLNAGTSFTGNIELVSGALSVNSPLTVVAFTQSGGTLQGTATFTTTGLYTWTAGTMTAAGITNVNGGLAMNGGTVDITGGRTLN